MPHPDFSYIRLSHSLAEPLQRKKKIWFFFSTFVQVSVFSVTAMQVIASPESWFNSLWLLSLFLSFFSFFLLTCKTHNRKALPKQRQQWSDLAFGLLSGTILGETGSLATPSSISHALDISYLFSKAPTTHMSQRYIRLPVHVSCVFWEFIASLDLWLALPRI